MRGADAAIVALWALAFAATIALAWTPWRRARRSLGISIPDGAGGSRVVTPLYLFIVPGFLLLAAVIFLYAKWRNPQVSVPSFSVFWMGWLVLMQVLLRHYVLAYLARRREARGKGWLTPDLDP